MCKGKDLKLKKQSLEAELIGLLPTGGNVGKKKRMREIEREIRGLEGILRRGYEGRYVV